MKDSLNLLEYLKKPSEIWDYILARNKFNLVKAHCMDFKYDLTEEQIESIVLYLDSYINLLIANHLFDNKNEPT